MSHLAFLSERIAIPLWLLIVMIGGMSPLVINANKFWRRLRAGKHPEMEEHPSMLMRLITIKQPSAGSTSSTRSGSSLKSKEKKTDMLHVLKVLASQGETGMLLQSIADRLQMPTSKVQRALESLVEKKLVDEVAGGGSMKYYLTEVGKNYCMRKGFIGAR